MGLGLWCKVVDKAFSYGGSSQRATQARVRLMCWMLSSEIKAQWIECLVSVSRLGRAEEGKERDWRGANLSCDKDGGGRLSFISLK